MRRRFGCVLSRNSIRLQPRWSTGLGTEVPSFTVGGQSKNEHALRGRSIVVLCGLHAGNILAGTCVLSQLFVAESSLTHFLNGVAGFEYSSDLAKPHSRLTSVVQDPFVVFGNTHPFAPVP